MAERHAAIARDAVEVVTRKLDTWLRRSRPPAMTASEAARLLDVAVKVERLSRGEPSNEVKFTPGPAFREIEDVNFIAEMIEAARRAGLLDDLDGS